jgi:hypothetical protein
MAYSNIPYEKEQGKIFKEQGTSAQEQGNLAKIFNQQFSGRLVGRSR